MNKLNISNLYWQIRERIKKERQRNYDNDDDDDVRFTYVDTILRWIVLISL